jgi:uncharacterized radical SAM superfamily Fe-S cluster-containing enzyme
MVKFLESGRKGVFFLRTDDSFLIYNSNNGKNVFIAADDLLSEDEVFAELGGMGFFEDPDFPSEAGLSKVLYMCFDVSNRCNLACRYCFSDKKFPDLPADYVEKVIEGKVLSAKKEKYIVDFSGAGEPLTPVSVSPRPGSSPTR